MNSTRQLKNYIILLFLLVLQSNYIKSMLAESEIGDDRLALLKSLQEENDKLNHEISLATDFKEVLRKKIAMSEKEFDSLVLEKRHAPFKFPFCVGGTLLGSVAIPPLCVGFLLLIGLSHLQIMR